jgi:hypothetical protein
MFNIPFDQNDDFGFRTNIHYSKYPFDQKTTQDTN